VREGLLVAVVLFGTTLTAAVPESQAIPAARPDGRVSVVNNLILERGVYRLDFRSGAFHLLAPANGKTFGAVFIGDGSYTFKHVTASEKRQLRLVTRDDKLEGLTDRFDEMVLPFTDSTADEVEKQAPAKNAAVDPRAVAAYESCLDWQKKISTNLHLRILEDMLNRPDRHDGVFLARVEGKKYAPALIAIDPLGISNLAAKFGSFCGDEVASLSLDNESSGFW
jgi:hypothetical protein